MAPTVHLVRHAQGLHNVSHDSGHLRDPDLTSFGRDQCQDLQRRFVHHSEITHLVASPLRRTISTCLIGFAPATGNGKRVIALPYAQEISAQPCDLGPSRAELAAEFGDQVDLSLVTSDWNDKSPSSQYAPTINKVEARARHARLELQRLAREAGEDACIVLVAHGGILHFITQEWDDLRIDRGTGWHNCEYRSYQFVDPTLADPDAKLRELKSSRDDRRRDAIPLTDAEQRELLALYPETLDTGIHPGVFPRGIPAALAAIE